MSDAFGHIALAVLVLAQTLQAVLAVRNGKGKDGFNSEDRGMLQRLFDRICMKH